MDGYFFRAIAHYPARDENRNKVGKRQNSQHQADSGLGQADGVAKQREKRAENRQNGKYVCPAAELIERLETLFLLHRTNHIPVRLVIEKLNNAR